MEDLTNMVNTSDTMVITSPRHDITISLDEIVSNLNTIASGRGVESLYDCPTNLFNTMLYEVGCRFIKGSKIYYSIVNNKSVIDYNVIKSIVSIYIYICFIYDKGISMRGFTDLLGLNTLMHPDDYEAIRAYLPQISEALKKADNDLQMARARDSKQAILQLAYNNYVHGWTGSIQSQTIKSTAKTLDDLKRERVEMSSYGGQ